jgi:UDP-2,3-diacylglucosamine hydrolase
VAYQRYRRWVNNRFLQRCFLALPQRFRQKISDKIKAKSRQQKQHKTTMIMDVNPQAVTQMMQRYNVRLLVHGHTHRPQIHAEGDRHRIVLGDWHDKASYLKFDGREFYLHDHRVAEADRRLRLS